MLLSKVQVSILHIELTKIFGKEAQILQLCCLESTYHNNRYANIVENVSIRKKSSVYHPVQHKTA